MSKYRSEVLWGVLFIVVMLIWMFFEKQMGWHDVNIDKHASYTNFFAIIAVLVYVVALLDIRKKKYGGSMSWKEGFFSGLIITIVAALLSPLAQYISLEVISPEYFRNAIDYAVKNKLQTAEEAEAYFNLQSYVLMAFPFAIITGIITSAVVAIFVRNKK